MGCVWPASRAVIPVSVIIVTKNAATQLPACLAALDAFEEIWIIDSPCGDTTPQIAAAHGATYIPYEWNGAYPKKRQWSLDHLPLIHDWVLFIDADEIMTPALYAEITALFSAAEMPRAAGYFIQGQYVWNGTLLKHGLRNHKIALLNRHKMHFPVVDDLNCPGMGEIEGHYQPVLKGTTGRIAALKHPLHHHANTDPQEWAARHQRYAAWERAMNLQNAWPTDPLTGRRILKTLLRHSPLKPYLAFAHSYILKHGYLDGANGFNLAKSRLMYYKLIMGKRI